MPLISSITFGQLLKQLRKRAGMTQADLAAAVGYSIPFISNLELNQRLPDVQMIMQAFIPALGLQDDPSAATALIEQAVLARGQRSPVAVTFQRTIQTVVQAEIEERTMRLPMPPAALIGRATIVNQICNRLSGHQGRLLTLVGPPGIGKTTLALAVATRLQHDYADGVVFVALAALNELTLVATTIAASVGSRDASPKPPQTKLIEFLRRKTMLLVLDNLEQIRDAAPLIAEFLAECPGLCILATSRERLHLRAEQRFNVPPLDLAPAVELFVQRAQAVNADFRLTPHNQPTLETICQRLDCLPLAIELCAAQIDLLSLTQLLAHLQTHRLDLLIEGAHDLPPRQRTLRTAIGHSYALLDEDERTLFRSLGVFVGGFALEAVTTVNAWGQATRACSLLATLHTLIGKSLVSSETTPSGEQRFLLLETIREFALEQVQAHGEEALLRQRHFAAYLHLFRTGDSYLRGREVLVWLARLKPEQDNLRAALQWSLDAAHYTDAAWLMLAVSYFWNLCGYGYEEARWLAQLLPHRQVLAPDPCLATLLTFYRAAGIFAEFQPIDRWTGEIMALLKVCADKLLHASAWSLIAGTMSDVAQVTAARERGIALAHAAGEAPGIGTEFCALADRDFILAAYLWGYAAFLIEQGELARATLPTQESLKLSQIRGDRGGIGDGLGGLGRLALLRGNMAQAHTLLREAVTIATTLGHSAMQCDWQPFLGVVTLYGGDASEARRLLTESLRLCLEVKNTFLLARIYTYLAEIALWEEAVDEAAQWLTQSLAYHADPHKSAIYEVTLLWVTARLATAQQQYQRAATLFGLAEQMHSQIHYAIAGPMRTLADAALATVREMLDPTVFATAFGTGQQLSLEEAYATILAPNPAGTIRSFLQQSANVEGLPFQPTAKRPNVVTLAALEELEGGKGKHFVNLDELITNL